MPIKILMPALSPTMTEGNLAKWLKKVGDKVVPGEVIAEIETDKATMEIESIDEGILAKIIVPANTDNVPVNALIAVILETGENQADLDNFMQTTRAGVAAPENASPPELALMINAMLPQPALIIEAAAGAPEQVAVILPLSVIAPLLPLQQQLAAIIPDQAASTLRPDLPTNHRIFASPLAKRLASLAGLELKNICGSGPYGRIIKADIIAITEATTIIASQQSLPAAAALVAASTAAEAPAPTHHSPASLIADTSIPVIEAPAPDRFKPAPVMLPGEHRLVPHTNLRKIIAKRLLESKQNIPHFYLAIECNIDKLLSLRCDINQMCSDDRAHRISINDLVILATAKALRAVPEVNASWSDQGINYYDNIDISIAVSIDGGLITPIIRQADQKNIGNLSAEIKQLALKARENRLMPAEFQGGSFSVSNLGMYGIKQFSAIINPPQSCILAVGESTKRPVVINDQIVISTIIDITLSCDHRVVDGAMGSKFLKVFKQLIESPLLILV